MYKTFKKDATGTSLFALTFGHDVILPLKVCVPSLRIAKQNNLTPKEFSEAILMELENVDKERLKAFTSTIPQKKRFSGFIIRRLKKRNLK